MTKAYSYIRFSSRAQANGGSLERQIEASAAYCAEQSWDLDDTLRDLGRSAFRGDHAKFGALGKFIEVAQAGEIEKGSWLIIESFDRLGRDEIMAAAQRFLAILECDIGIVTLSDKKQWTKASMNGSFGDFVISIALMARAHEESLIKSQRSSHNWQRARERATEFKMTATCPAWLRLAEDRKSFDVIPERVAVIRRIYNETLAGIGRETIATRLNRDGVPAFRSEIGWHQSSVAKILSNQAVIGVFQPHRGTVPEGDPIKDYYPPIVEEAIFWQVQARRRAPAGRKGHLLSNLFTGLAHCGRCGANLGYIVKGEGRRYLMCSAARRGLCENRTRHPYQKLETEMIEALRLFDFSRLLRPPADARADALAAEIESKTATANHMVATFSATSPSAVGRRIEALYAEAEAAKVELAKLKAEQVRKPADFGALRKLLGSEMTADERYQLRSKIAAEMRRLIADMIADGDRILVRTKPGPYFRVELRIARSEIACLDLWWSGITGHPDELRIARSEIECLKRYWTVGGVADRPDHPVEGTGHILCAPRSHWHVLADRLELDRLFEQLFEQFVGK